MISKIVILLVAVLLPLSVSDIWAQDNHDHDHDHSSEQKVSEKQEHDDHDHAAEICGAKAPSRNLIFSF